MLLLQDKCVPIVWVFEVWCQEWATWSLTTCSGPLAKYVECFLESHLLSYLPALPSSLIFHLLHHSVLFFVSSSRCLCYVIWCLRMPAAGRVKPDSWRIDGMLLQSGDHRNIAREEESFLLFFFPSSVVTVGGVGLGLRWQRKMENKRRPKFSLQHSSCQSSPHCSKLPTSWLDVTSWILLLLGIH